MADVRDPNIKAACRVLSFDDPKDPRKVLAALAQYAARIDANAADKYGQGELVERLEQRVATILGKPAAAFIPSGKAAQLGALRVLAGRRGIRRLALHPRAHIEEYELRAYQELYGLTAVPLGGYDRLPTADDVDAVAVESLAAICLELPQRRLGCLLPTWDALIALSERAHNRGIPLHADAARLWESQPFYAPRTHAEICALFDTVMVSFDKGLNGLAGAAIAGDPDIVAEIRLWQKRVGARPLHAFPYILAALKGLDERLPMMAAFHEKAIAIARALRDVPGVLAVTPNPPHVNAMLIYLSGDAHRMQQAKRQVAKDLGIWLFDEPVDTRIQSMAAFEITVRGAAMTLNDDNIASAVERLAALIYA